VYQVGCVYYVVMPDTVFAVEESSAYFVVVAPSKQEKISWKFVT
jgi:hypothetical protein